MSEPVLLAVDGGNSKTDVALVREDGSVLSLVRGQGSSPHQLGLSRAVRVVADLVDRAWFEARPEQRDGHRALAAAVFMAGADLPEEEAALADAIRGQNWADATMVANDVHALLWAATGRGDGVAVTVGAGVNCVGRSPDGRTAWFPALGPITGDWGGGHELGLAALGAGVRAEDLRGPATTLAAAVAAAFGRDTSLDVAVAVHQGTLHRDRLMELAPLVVREARRGDEVALAIVHRQADEVTALALAALRQLLLLDRPVDIVLGGSVLAAMGDLVLDRIRDGITAEAAGARVTLCTTRPVMGAAVAAMHLAGLDGSAVAHVQLELGGDDE
ncbi:MAG: ATPase [Candidatus Dormibacteraeota bacterium]|nr:ATPase [Candidatus Dormibacteraeota bacterium]MBV8445390.1 ATPase [Candidatus Dormibacteraeota bacterium]